MDQNTFAIIMLGVNLLIGLLSFLFKLNLNSLNDRLHAMEEKAKLTDTRLMVSETTYAAQSVRIDGIYVLLDLIHKSIDKLNDKFDLKV